MHTRTTIRPVILLGMIALIAITAIATAPTCCAAPGSGNTDIKITVNELAPQPVEPGRDLVLSVTLGNYGRGVAEHAVLMIMPDSPIVLKNENDRIIRHDRIIGYGAHVETYLLYILTFKHVQKIDSRSLHPHSPHQNINPLNTDFATP